MEIKANRGRSICKLTEGKLYAPESAEYVSWYVLFPIFEIDGGDYDGYVYTAVHSLRHVRWTKGSIVIGCCAFNKKNTEILRKWVENQGR